MLARLILVVAVAAVVRALPSTSQLPYSLALAADSSRVDERSQPARISSRALATQPVKYDLTYEDESKSTGPLQSTTSGESLGSRLRLRNAIVKKQLKSAVLMDTSSIAQKSTLHIGKVHGNDTVNDSVKLTKQSYYRFVILWVIGITSLFTVPCWIACAAYVMHHRQLARKVTQYEHEKLSAQHYQLYTNV